MNRTAGSNAGRGPAPPAGAAPGETSFLSRKAERVRQALLTAPAGAELGALRRRAAALPLPASLQAALTVGPNVALIAEFKRRSPSAGELPGAAEAPSAVAAQYRTAGAAGISVLTDSADFGGSLADLAEVAAVVELPVLRKDFILHPAQLFEARSAGAAAALLIAGLLKPAELASLLAAAQEVELECLVEVHDEEELSRALDAGARLIGINNRDLRSLQTDLAVTERLAPLLPADATLVSESGVRGAGDVARLRDAGAHAVLVGELLMRCSRAERLELASALAAVPR